MCMTLSGHTSALSRLVVAQGHGVEAAFLRWAQIKYASQICCFFKTEAMIEGQYTSPQGGVVFATQDRYLSASFVLDSLPARLQGPAADYTPVLPRQVFEHISSSRAGVHGDQVLKYIFVIVLYSSSDAKPLCGLWHPYCSTTSRAWNPPSMHAY